MKLFAQFKLIHYICRMIRKRTQKTSDKRKLERQCLPDFFQKHIEIIKSEKRCCEECGIKLVGDVSEVAHRLPKSVFKSVQCLDDNVLYLCSWKSGGDNCHSKYDGSNEQLWSLSIFPAEKIKIQELLKKLTEKINYKLYDKWQI